MEDFTNRKINKLTVIKFSYRTKKNIFWECLCECGNYRLVSSSHLKRFRAKSCGKCFKPENLVGTKFGENSKVLKYIRYNNKNQQYIYLVQCRCGNILEKQKSKIINNEIACRKCCFKYGDQHHSWNPKVTDYERIERRKNKKYFKFINSIYKRDNYSCKLCNIKRNYKKNIILNAHHLNCWHIYKEQRYDTNNVITLCVSCHKKFHQSYSYKNTTKGQFEQFMNVYFNKSLKDIGLI